jgi:hypothetical protein
MELFEQNLGALSNSNVQYWVMCRQCGAEVKHRLQNPGVVLCVNGHTVAPPLDLGRVLSGDDLPSIPGQTRISHDPSKRQGSRLCGLETSAQLTGGWSAAIFLNRASTRSSAKADIYGCITAPKSKINFLDQIGSSENRRRAS